MFPSLRVVLLSLCVATSGLCQSDGKDYPPPTLNHPWKHEASGLRFPSKLAGVECSHRYEYADKDLGVMLRYPSAQQSIRADLFIYPCSAPHGTREEMQKAVVEEAGKVLGEIKGTEKRGVYSDVKSGEATYGELNLLPEGSGHSCLLEMGVELTHNQKQNENAEATAPEKLHSKVVLSVYNGFFVKLRCSYPQGGGEKTEKTVGDLVSNMRMLILDPGLRTMTAESIANYRKDPLSEKARDSVGGVVVYAEKSNMFDFTVWSSLAALAEPWKPQFPEAEMDFFRAYLVGAVGAAIQEPLPENVDLEQEGAREVLKLNDILAKQKTVPKSELMQDFQKAVNDGEGAAWFRAQDAKSK